MIRLSVSTSLFVHLGTFCYYLELIQYQSSTCLQSLSRRHSCCSPNFYLFWLLMPPSGADSAFFKDSNSLCMHHEKGFAISYLSDSSCLWTAVHFSVYFFTWIFFLFVFLTMQVSIWVLTQIQHLETFLLLRDDCQHFNLSLPHKGKRPSCE